MGMDRFFDEIAAFVDSHTALVVVVLIFAVVSLVVMAVLGHMARRKHRRMLPYLMVTLAEESKANKRLEQAAWIAEALFNRGVPSREDRIVLVHDLPTYKDRVKAAAAHAVGLVPPGQWLRRKRDMESSSLISPVP